jgi:hypothetical protein
LIEGAGGMPRQLFVSIVQPKEGRADEWIAALWQGPGPENAVVRQWLYLPGSPRRMMMVWEGDEAAKAFVDRTFSDFCRVETEVVTDATPGMQCAFARDLEGFETWMRDRGDPPEMIGRWVELRRRGRDSPSLSEALAAARAWAAET